MDIVPENFIYNYQTLITGVIATILAIVTTILLSSQWNKERRGRLRANRPLLASALSRMAELIDDDIQLLIDLRYDTKFRDQLRSRELPQTEELLRDDLETIGLAIELADRKSAEHLSSILEMYQIHRSRLRSKYRRGRANLLNLEFGVIYALKLVARIEASFEYSRSETKSIQFNENQKNYRVHLISLGAAPDLTPELFKRIEKLTDE